ncbi:uncharacterized protein DUF397 [Actinomadura pelletieri DSM 43383]|uniref:Uncharacterized protein DUF397 n=1 Tax=Actinomadura pelletieri DSM 43383 TaxID=1120940 RepID=A0A495QZ25_9ACTN|nr:DUF397 domain-containing protein [Actinomadura pelletieri]RKS79382.1 uncharacterized protein DUF397 [Actinomadura pelletieri DSM 43383]
MNVEWRKSSRSGGGGGTMGDCVELASMNGKIGIRDSKNPNHGHLTVGRDALRDLVNEIKSGDLDL